jgi:hypothetical protein
LILHLTFCKSRLKDLNLFVKESKLIVSTDKLGSEDVSLIDDILVVLLELLMLFVSFLNNVG